MNDHIVVYRSEFEKLQDEFWMDFLENNAVILYWLSHFVFWFLVSCVLSIIFKRIFNKRPLTKWEEKCKRRKF